MTKTIYVLSFALLLTACAGTPFKWDNARTLRAGMTQEEVTAIMGPPYMATSTPAGTTWTWSYAEAFGGARAVSVVFTDGHLAKVPDIPPAYK